MLEYRPWNIPKSKTMDYVVYTYVEEPGKNDQRGHAGP